MIDPDLLNCRACATPRGYHALYRGLCPACRETAPRCIACRSAVGPKGCTRCHVCPTEGCDNFTPFRWCTDCLEQENERIRLIRQGWYPIGASGPTLARRETDELGYVPGLDPGFRGY